MEPFVAENGELHGPFSIAMEYYRSKLTKSGLGTKRKLCLRKMTGNAQKICVFSTIRRPRLSDDDYGTFSFIRGDFGMNNFLFTRDQKGNSQLSSIGFCTYRSMAGVCAVSGLVAYTVARFGARKVSIIRIKCHTK